MSGGWHWMSSPRMTVAVEVNPRGVLIDGPPIVHKFLGQSVANLEDWLRRQGGFLSEVLEEVAGPEQLSLFEVSA